MKLLVVCLLATTAHADTLSMDPLSGAVGFTGKNLGDWSITYAGAARCSTRHPP